MLADRCLFTNKSSRRWISLGALWSLGVLAIPLFGAACQAETPTVSSVSSNVSGANPAVPGDDLVLLAQQAPELFAALAALNAEMATGTAQALEAISAGAIVSPVAAVINDGGPGFGLINDTFNQSGLTAGFASGVTSFDAYLATTPRHSMIFLGFEWFGNAGTTGATVTYDLGSVVAIDRLALWNEESSGIGTLNLFSSTDGVTFTLLASSLRPTDHAITAPIDSPPYPADVFAFASTSARFVRFVITDSPQPNPGSFPAAAIGEVAFRVTANQPPVALCRDVTVDADQSCSADASIDNGSFDPDGDAITCAQAPAGPYGLGITAVTLTCTDAGGLSSSCTGLVTVQDVTPPVVVQGPPTVLWPPNHRYVSFSLESCIESITDQCDGTISAGSAQISRVTSDEPDDVGGGGDGNTENDMVITGATTVDLRAERQGGGDGRVYEVQFTVQDAAGNVTRGSCPVQVPHDQSGAAAIDSGDASCVGPGC
jgi:hypothetical protein